MFYNNNYWSLQGPVNGETEPPSEVASSAIVQSVQQESFKVGGLINVKQNFITKVSLLFSAARQMVFTGTQGFANWTVSREKLSSSW